MYAQVIVPLPLPPLTYRIPEGLELRVGDPVKVLVRQKKLDGIVLEIKKEIEKSSYTIKNIEEKSSDLPFLTKETLGILEWAADYYHYPAGEVLRGFLPPNPVPPQLDAFQLSQQAKANPTFVPKGKVQRALFLKLQTEGRSFISSEERPAARKLVEAGWLEKIAVEDDATPTPPPSRSSPFQLTAHQAAALEKIRQSQESKKFQTFLIQGVTGSGKTEIYLTAAAHALALGKNVLVVVPEIALTPQLVSRFQKRLGENIAVLHSGISDGERSRQWHKLNRGKYRVCIGARSAAFAPIQNIGLIVVDEEHDSALKQEDHLRYNARDLAIVRGKASAATVLLGSATPSLESFHNGITGRYQHILLPERASGRTMPEVRVIDRSKDSITGSISPHLRKAMEETLNADGQVMLLLNRRGFSSFLLCSSCGAVPECPNCSVTLTNYLSSKILKCHYCGHNEKRPSHCEKCESDQWLPGTLGTESLENEVKELFPGKTVLRIDRESMERKGALERALESISSGEAEIIIGTQIIAKGHDFPNIGLVGVVNADASFHLPDFRASEKSFQLFTQMAGRAGRGERPGKVLLQTFNPKHPSIIYAQNHDYRTFAEEEMRIRHLFHYPPFTRMARILFSAPTSNLAENAAEKIAAFLAPHAQRLKVELIGPAPAALAKLQNRYRWNILLKAEKAVALHSLLLSLSTKQVESLGRKILLQVDVDPVSLM